MANWRRQQGESHHYQVGHWRSSSSSFNNYNRKPPLDNWHSTVPAWERKFCATVGSVPWRKLLECKKYMNLHSNVVNWDDSAGKEAFDNAKRRFWDEMNGLPSDISLPNPNMYIDNVDWNSTVDPELLLDLEKARFEEEASSEVGSLSQLQLQDLPIFPTGWEIEEERPSNPLSAVVAQGWGYDLHENDGAGSWGMHFAHVEPAEEHEWQYCQNDSWGWNQRGNYGGNSHSMGRGRAGRNGNGDGNWGTWDGYNRRRDNMPWSRNPAYHHGNQMNRGRGNYRGRRRGSFTRDRPYEDNIPTTTTTAWQVKT